MVRLQSSTRKVRGTASATRPCWKQVQDDWTNNRLGSTTYAPNCYDQAIKNLGGDVKYYSNAVDEIHAAEQPELNHGAWGKEITAGSRLANGRVTGGW